MSAINYTYFITIGGTETPVHPSGDWSLKIAKAEEDFPFCKDYRIKFDGEFIFSGDDYDLIKTADCCDKIDLRIQCDGTNYWYGYFAYPYDLKFDEDRCEVSGTPKPLDKYYYFDLYADYKREIVTSDDVTWQRNFPEALVGDAIWQGNVSNCVRCEPIMDVIDDRFLRTPLVPGGFTLDLKSTFFKNDIFPDGTDPYPSGPGAINYVTGCATKLNHVVMVLAADIYDVAGGAPWTDALEMTFNEFIEAVHNTFNTWWYIDEAGDFRIEHIYFWCSYWSFNSVSD